MENTKLYAYGKYATHKEALDAVTRDGYELKYIRNATETIQKAAILNAKFSIQFIDKPSIDLQRLVVTLLPYAVRYIKNPAQEVVLSAIKQEVNGWYDATRYDLVLIKKEDNVVLMGETNGTTSI